MVDYQLTTFYYNHCVNTSDGGLLVDYVFITMTVDTSDGGLLVDYVFITMTVSIPRLMDYLSITFKGYSQYQSDTESYRLA